MHSFIYYGAVISSITSYNVYTCTLYMYYNCVWVGAPSYICVSCSVLLFIVLAYIIILVCLICITCMKVCVLIEPSVVFL